MSPPSLQPTGGPAGTDDAFLQIQAGGSNLATHNSLAAWTGDYAAVGASTISVDLMNAAGSAPLAMRLVLFGPGSTNIRWTSTTAMSIPADGVWRNYSFSLAEADLTRVLGTGTYAGLMGNVFRAMFRHDPAPPSSGGTPVSATLGLDNIRIAAAPEPVAGDYDGDQDVDLDDYRAWQAAFGSTGANLAPDGNGDSTVNSADYTVWRDALAAPGTGRFARAQTVPEPCNTLLAAALFVFCAVRRFDFNTEEGDG
jgi:hypothetical protein